MADIPVNFPGAKVLGYNLVPLPGDTWGAMFQTWDWLGYIRPQINSALALGCQAIRCIGALDYIQNGTFSQSYYNSKWVMLAAYCQQQGIYLYPTPSAFNQVVGGMTDAQYAASFISLMTALQPYNNNLLGMDTMSEGNLWSDVNAVSRLLNIHTLIRAGVTVPYGLTVSTTELITSFPFLTSIINACDFLDFHPYPFAGYGINNPPTQAQMTAGPRASYPNKDVMFGEFGAAESNTGSEIVTFISGCVATSRMTDAHVRGGLFWTLRDQDVPPNFSNMYGLYNASLVSNAFYAKGLVNGSSGSSIPTAPTPPQLLAPDPGFTPDLGIYWNPTNCCSMYDHTRLYRNGAVLVNSLNTGTYDDSAHWQTNQSRYQSSVISATFAESSLSPNSILPGRLSRKALKRRAQATFR